MADTAELRRVVLNQVHEAAGARMVPFAGWRMPLQYEGIIAEHMAVRTRAGLFDVSHMGQLRVAGEAAIAELQRIASNDLRRIDQVGQAQYSLLLNERGGIEDDIIVYRIAAQELLLVVNAANRERDAVLLDGIAVDESDGWSMFALQGPVALDVLARAAGVDVRDLAPFRFVGADVAGHACIVATTGYTGERGCEVLVPADGAADVWRLLAADPEVTLCGLGARDTLRLEACFPLHGSDISPDTDPVGAGLGFAAPATVDAVGPAHVAVAGIRAVGPGRKLVPLLATGRGIARSGASVCAGADVVGTVTSGTMSPVLRTGIALAWVDAAHAALDTELEMDVRGSRVGARVVRKPFMR